MGKYFLPAIMVLAFLLRFLSIGQYPMGFNADEASFGYDAYSILKTGHDQWGSFMPLVLKSFGDYKSPVYGYLAIPSVAVFGLNVFATRLPNVIIGTLAVLAVYLLVKEIVNGQWLMTKKENLTINDQSLAVIASLLLAINPWSVMMSRGAFEANLITFFLPMGIYLFLRGLKENRFFIWSAVFFGINLFTYHSAKLITPLIIVGLIILFGKNLLKTGLKKLLLPVIILVIFFGALGYTLTVGGGARIAERSITQGALIQGFDERMVAISEGMNPTVAKIFHNKYQVIAGNFVNNYLQYFSLKFLVFQGAGDGSYGMIPGIGVIYFAEYFLLLGLIPLLIIEKKYRKLITVLLVWLAITPLTGALASGVGYSGNRAEGMIPVLQILESLGFFGWVLVLKRYKFLPAKAMGVVFVGILVFQVYGFLNSYYKTPSNLVLKQMLYGNMEASEWISQNSVDRTILVSRSIGEPQIFIAFVNKWDPENYQNFTGEWDVESAKVSWLDQLPEYKLNNYTITSIDWKKEYYKGNTLIVCRPDELPAGFVPLQMFNYPDGTPNIFIVNPNQKHYAQAI